MLRTKLAAGAMSAVLAATLSPGLAMAATLGGGTIADQGATESTQELAPQAKKKATVYVISSIGYSDSYQSSESTTDSDGNTVTKPITVTNNYLKQYTYSKSGLITKAANVYETKRGSSKTTSQGSSYALQYKKGALSKITYKSSPTSTSPTVYNFKSKYGMPSRVDTKYVNPGYDQTSKTIYKYNFGANGVLQSYDQEYYSKYNYEGELTKKFSKRYVYTYSYVANKNGRLTQMTQERNSIDGAYSREPVVKYKYDKKGNLNYTKSGLYKPSKYKLTYKKGRLATRQIVADSYTGTKYEYKWKKVKVPASSAKLVQAQQWALINNNMNRAFGPVTLGS